ncbi:MAG TPA: four helix bundle protein [Candidatus Saccharimonadales bacterium]|nr:four helix bundle protein [Candidatus Saccharimonadales bacterium]
MTEEDAIMSTSTKQTTMAVRTFRDLRVWQAAYDMTVALYRQCEQFPKHELYALTNQMTRAAVSVCSNIAEGFGRRSLREKDQFYAMANGSLTELENQLLICRGVGYITSAQFLDLQRRCYATHKMLVALQNVNRSKSDH